MADETKSSASSGAQLGEVGLKISKTGIVVNGVVGLLVFLLLVFMVGVAYMSERMATRISDKMDLMALMVNRVPVIEASLVDLRVNVATAVKMASDANSKIARVDELSKALAKAEASQRRILECVKKRSRCADLDID